MQIFPILKDLEVFMKWFEIALTKYAVFEGRARRKEYWTFQFVNIIVILLLTTAVRQYETIFFSVITILYLLAIFIPTLAVFVRRLHDVGKPGIMFFVNFVPALGIIWLFILMCTDGQHGANLYGEDPKNEISEDTDATDQDTITPKHPI